VFAGIFRFQQDLPITPADIESALRHPELDPLCGEIVSKMLARKLSRQEENPEISQPVLVKYDVWNE
jgi:hypothetical protein